MKLWVTKMYNSLCQSSRFIAKKVHDNSKSKSNITIGLHLLCHSKLHVHIVVLTDQSIWGVGQGTSAPTLNILVFPICSGSLHTVKRERINAPNNISST